MSNASLKKAVDFAIAQAEKEVENLENKLEINDYMPLQRSILEKKLNELQSDLSEFRSIAIS